MDAVNNWHVSPIFNWKSHRLPLTITRRRYTRGNSVMSLPLGSMQVVFILTASTLIGGQQSSSQLPTQAASPPRPTTSLAVAVDSPANEKMPKTGLTPTKLIPNLCSVHYRISTSSPDCQAFFDQGLGYLYSYVWMEASRSFETAA